MIFGDPYKFALAWEVPDIWKELRPRFHEGFIFMYVDGVIFPGAGLKTGCVERNLSMLRENFIKNRSRLDTFPLSGVPRKAYEELHKRAFLQDLWDCRCESESMEDSDINIFLSVRNDGEHIYAGVGEKYVSHVIVDSGYFIALIKEATKCFYEKFPLAKGSGWWRAWEREIID